MLVFIDTNVLLDFYRIRSREAGLSILGKLEQNLTSIISGDQISMEFKKNRHNAILESHKAFKAPDWASLTLPPVLADSKSSRALERHKKGIRDQSSKLKRRLESVLQDPSRYDPVYRTLQRVFNHKGPYNLTRDKKIRVEIREKAQKRFLLGYPPRKQSDTSIGDAINWEWIIHCAKESGSGVVIITRDSDYGAVVNSKPVLNDWLRQEFKARVSRTRKLVLTDRLSDGLKAADITLTKQETDAEDALIETTYETPHDEIVARLVELIKTAKVRVDSIVIDERTTPAEGRGSSK
jgi:hypothetical protein